MAHTVKCCQICGQRRTTSNPRARWQHHSRLIWNLLVTTKAVLFNATADVPTRVPTAFQFDSFKFYLCSSNKNMKVHVAQKTYHVHCVLQRWEPWHFFLQYFEWFYRNIRDTNVLLSWLQLPVTSQRIQWAHSSYAWHLALWLFTPLRVCLRFKVTILLLSGQLVST